MEKKIIVAGHTCIDMTPIFKEGLGTQIRDILIPGKTITTEGFKMSCGGIVSNSGLALKRLGGDAVLMGKIGNDFLGDLVLKEFAKYGAEGDLIRSDTDATSYTLVLALPGIDRIFLHDSAANGTFGMDDLDFDKIRNACVFLFGYPPLMKKMYQNNGAELIAMFSRVREAGTATALDMTEIDAFSEANKEDWKEIVRKLTPDVDLWLPSAPEICYMIDPERHASWLARTGGGDITDGMTTEDVEPLADQLLAWGAKIVMIKCGKSGMFLKTAGPEQIRQVGGGLIADPAAWANLRHFEKSYQPEKVLSGTGAGDTCNAAFLLAMSRGYPWQRCLQLAAATGASCVEAYDALSGLRSFAELEAKIDAGWKKAED